MRIAGWHGDLQPSPLAGWRPGRSDDAGSGREDWRKGPAVVSQRLVSVTETGDRLDGKGSHPPHRRLDEWPAGRLLHARQDARHGCPAFSWRTLAGDSGWRGAH